MPRPVLFIILILGLISCNKKSDPAPSLPAGGSWTADGITCYSEYSETESRKGYQLTFADNSGTNSLSFLFRSRPTAAGTFTAASDTSKASNIYVRLVSKGVAYHSVSSNATITTDMAEGKLFLKGSRIRMSADSTSDADADLDFSLREY
jgi:hypothetical protein